MKAATSSDDLVRFERFEAVVRTLHDTGVPFIADGTWRDGSALSPQPSAASPGTGPSPSEPRPSQRAGPASSMTSPEAAPAPDSASTGPGPTLPLRDRAPFAIRDEGLPFDCFAAIVQALNGAGGRYVLDGAWFLDPDYDAPLFWKGLLVIPRQHEAVYEAYVALASIDHEPRPATSPEELVAWEQPERWNDGDPDQPEFVPIQAFVSAEHPTATIRLAAVSLELLESDWKAAEAQELAPGMPVLTLNPAEEGTIPCEGPQRLSEVRFFDEWLKELDRMVEERE